MWETSVKKNGGQCFDGSPSGTEKFSCNCVPPYVGERCETNQCEGIECQNGGTCVEGQCDCPENSAGDRCQILSCGNDIPCYNGGTCNGETCQCSQEDGIAKYHGVSCDIPAACDGNPCQNGGTCSKNTLADNTQVCFKINFDFISISEMIMKLWKTFECSCMNGFTGDFCEFKTEHDHLLFVGTTSND